MKPPSRRVLATRHESAFSIMTSSPNPSPLGPFAHLPAYNFHFDYRGHAIQPPPAPSPPPDDFDSYIFPSEAPSVHSPASPPPPPPPPIDWLSADAAPLYTPDGTPYPSDNLYTSYSRLTVLLFVPRTSIELVALVYGKIAHLLHQNSARLIFVTPWQPKQAAIFLSRFERISPFPGPLICDPHASLFSAFGFTRSPLRALFAGGIISKPMRQGVRNALSTVTYRAQNRDISNTPVSSNKLKCGAVVMSSLRGYAKRPSVSYISPEMTSTGAGCYLDVMAACGLNEAFVPHIDVALVFKRFNSMRATSIKARCAQEKELARATTKQRPSSRKSDRNDLIKPT